MIEKLTPATDTPTVTIVLSTERAVSSSPLIDTVSGSATCLSNTGTSKPQAIATTIAAAGSTQKDCCASLSRASSLCTPGPVPAA